MTTNVVKLNFLLVLFLLASNCARALQPIVGPDSCCVGTHITLNEKKGKGGIWLSSNPAIARIDSVSGVVTGISQGTATISYQQKGKIATLPFRVVAPVDPGIISGYNYVTLGKTLSLSHLPTRYEYYWASSTPGVATVDSKSGVVTGVSAGVATITYNMLACGSVVSASAKVYATPADCIAGVVNFPGGYQGPVRVTLVHYNPATKENETAKEAIYQCTDSAIFYQFTAIRPDAYRVRASVLDTTTYRYGFNTTYHPSNYYWYNGNIINHNAETADHNINITMIYGRFQH